VLTAFSMFLACAASALKLR